MVNCIAVYMAIKRDQILGRIRRNLQEVDDLVNQRRGVEVKPLEDGEFISYLSRYPNLCILSLFVTGTLSATSIFNLLDDLASLQVISQMVVLNQVFLLQYLSFTVSVKAAAFCMGQFYFQMFNDSGITQTIVLTFLVTMILKSLQQ